MALGAAVNHWPGATMISAASSPNSEGDKTGVINRVFRYIPALREGGQNLRKRSRKLYYGLKYLTIAAVFAAIIVPSLL